MTARLDLLWVFSDMYTPQTIFCFFGPYNEEIVRFPISREQPVVSNWLTPKNDCRSRFTVGVLFLYFFGPYMIYFKSFDITMSYLIVIFKMTERPIFLLVCNIYIYLKDQKKWAKMGIENLLWNENFRIYFET